MPIFLECGFLNGILKCIPALAEEKEFLRVATAQNKS